MIFKLETQYPNRQMTPEELEKDFEMEIGADQLMKVTILMAQ